MKQNYIKILKRLISLNSVLTSSNQEITDYISSLFKLKHCYRVTTQSIKSSFGLLYNLIIKLPGSSSEKPLVFAGHSDTVPPNSQWKKDPFNARKTSNKLYGLGSSDMKGALAIMIDAMLTAPEKPKQDIYLIITADEEGMGLGIRNLPKKLKLKNADIIIGESTEGRIRLGQKAVLSYKLNVISHSQHAAYVPLEQNQKINPIQQLQKLLSGLTQWAKDNNRQHQTYGGITFNPGLVYSGTNANSLPSNLEAEFEFRFPPLLDFKNLDKLDKSIRTEISKILNSKQYKLEKTFYGGFSETKKSSSLVKKLQSVAKNTTGKKLGFFNGLGWTEASVYEQFGDVVILGPGTISAQHAPDEYVELKNLKLISLIYKNLIKV